MRKFITTMEVLINSLKEHPEKDHELGELIRQCLNKYFPKCRCDRVFITKNNDCNHYIANVIPKIESGNTKATDYDIDIDLSSLSIQDESVSISAIEMVTWIYHELLANVITDETLLRYKKLIIKFQNPNNRKTIDINGYYGTLARISIFSRTAKEYIEDIHMSSGVNFMIASTGLEDNWNSVLDKYINMNGGNPTIISEDHVDRMDKTNIREFNKLARRYGTDVVRVKNTDYATMIKYIIASTKSELVKAYCEEEPHSIFFCHEANSFTLFDDNRLLKDDQYNATINKTVNNIVSTTDLRNKFDKYVIDADNINTAMEKIALCANIHNLIIQISDKITEYTSSVSSVPYDTSVLTDLKMRCNDLLEKVKKLDLDHKISVDEID